MSDLNAKARALVDAARREDRTPGAARDRVRGALAARVGAAAFEPGPRDALSHAGGAKGTPVTMGLGSTKIVGAAVLALALFGSGVLVGRVTAPASVPAPGKVEAPPPEHARAMVSPTATPTGTQVVVEEPPKPPASPPAKAVEARVAARPATAERRTPPPPRDAPPPSAEPKSTQASPPPKIDTLGQETALLRDAQAAMREGNAAAALQKLDSMASAYPDGVLREERRAARVLALCAAGEVDEARAEAQRFLREAPRSPVAERVRASCATTPR